MSEPKWRDKTHRSFYKFPDLDKKFPGVTSVIGKLDKPFLLPAARRLWKEGKDHEKLWNAKRDLGTEVHDAIEGPGLFPGHPLFPYIEQAHLASQELGLDWFAHEVTLVNVAMGYAGTLDLWSDKGRIIADWKTGKLYGSASLQLSALLDCTHQALDSGELVPLPLMPNTGWAIHLAPTTWEARQVKINTDQHQANMECFSGLLAAFYWEKNDWPWTGQAQPFL